MTEHEDTLNELESLLVRQIEAARRGETEDMLAAAKRMGKLIERLTSAATNVSDTEQPRLVKVAWGLNWLAYLVRE